MGGSAAASTGFAGKTNSNRRIHLSADGSRLRAEPCIPQLPCALSLLALRWKTGREGGVNDTVMRWSDMQRMTKNVGVPQWDILLRVLFEHLQDVQQ